MRLALLTELVFDSIATHFHRIVTYIKATVHDTAEWSAYYSSFVALYKSTTLCYIQYDIAMNYSAHKNHTNKH